MKLLIFLVFKKYGLAVNMELFSKYQYLIGWRIKFSDTWCNNCQSDKAMAET